MGIPSISLPKISQLRAILRETTLVALATFILLKLIEWLRPYSVRIVFNPRILFEIGLIAAFLSYLTTETSWIKKVKTVYRRLPLAFLRDTGVTLLGGGVLFYLLPSLSGTVKFIFALPATVTLFVLLRLK